ncbi:MAG: glycosyltransferase family 4 protein, partial [Nautiliaceae bacterium]
MKAVILTPTLVPYDAVSNDVRLQHKVLNEILPSYIYTDSYKEDGYSSKYLISKEDLANLTKEDIIIYHHSVYWEFADKFLFNTKAKIFIKYHNITPPGFFSPYSRVYENVCKMGYDQNKRLKTLNAVFMADSKYNALEFPGAKVVPVFTILEDFNGEIDASFAEKILKNDLNILFVGRFAPNKGHRHLVKTLYFLKEYGLNPTLHIAGGIDRELISYVDEIKRLIDFYSLSQNVIIYDKLEFKKLLTLYKTSDMFLLMSEHEGFCVPVLESQKSSLPLVAVDRAAVKETAGENQL